MSQDGHASRARPFLKGAPRQGAADTAPFPVRADQDGEFKSAVPQAGKRRCAYKYSSAHGLRGR
jgi:hypothetical protein